MNACLCVGVKAMTAVWLWLIIIIIIIHLVYASLFEIKLSFWGALSWPWEMFSMHDRIVIIRSWEYLFIKYRENARLKMVRQTNQNFLKSTRTKGRQRGCQVFPLFREETSSRTQDAYILPALVVVIRELDFNPYGWRVCTKDRKQFMPYYSVPFTFLYLPVPLMSLFLTCGCFLLAKHFVDTILLTVNKTEYFHNFLGYPVNTLSLPTLHIWSQFSICMSS